MQHSAVADDFVPMIKNGFHSHVLLDADMPIVFIVTQFYPSAKAPRLLFVNFPKA